MSVAEEEAEEKEEEKDEKEAARLTLTMMGTSTQAGLRPQTVTC